MLRIIGIVMVCLTVAGAGFVYYEGLRKRARHFESLLLFSKSCTDEMRSRNQNVFEILSKHAENELKYFSNINSENIKSKVTLRNILKSKELSEAEVEMVAAFLNVLGTSDISSQESMCECYSKMFERFLKSAEHNVAEKGKTVRSLCLLLSCAVFIILI